MTRIGSDAARRRRLVTRTLPISVLAVGSFAVGAVVGGTDELAAAKRFAQAWEQHDFEAMYAELAPAAQAEYSVEEVGDLYEEAEQTATVAVVDTGDVDGAEAAGGDAAAVRVRLETHAFGEVGGEVVLPLEDGWIAWEPHLTFPELNRGERLERRTRAPERAAIVARDGTPLAEGPAVGRSSPLGTAAQSVAGVVGAPSTDQAEELAGLGFPPGTLAGTTGLELAFNDRLAGKPGGQLLAAPEGGTGERVLLDREPAAGKRVRTTIDPKLQQAAVTALGERFGGAAVLDAKDGSVRALAGLAFSAPQPPGSTFKIITTVAALDAGLVKTTDQFPVATGAVVGGREIANAYNESCGGTFVESFAHSCNSVFAPLGAKVGSERLVEAAVRFGFNSPPPLYEAKALETVDVPSSTLPTELADDLEEGVTAIGQGEVLATPLQLASMAQTIAGEGTRSPTSIVRDAKLRADAERVRVTSQQTAATVRDLMIQVVTSGTGRAGALPGVQVAGKTGTAELGPKPLAPGQQVAPGEQPAQEVDAWFTAFAPARDPKLAVAVMLVNAEGDGGEVAAPIVREILAAGLG